jgi:hypothetical protein
MHKTITVEWIFHGLAIAMLLRGFFSGADMMQEATTAGVIIALGRGLPTEKVDHVLDKYDRPIFPSDPPDDA